MLGMDHPHPRVDTVHQGDLDGIKGAYPINAIDEVTQGQEVDSVGHHAIAFRASFTGDSGTLSVSHPGLSFR